MSESVVPGSFSVRSQIPKIAIPTNPLVENAKDNLASEFHKRLTKWISDFDASLDEAHEM